MKIAQIVSIIALLFTTAAIATPFLEVKRDCEGCVTGRCDCGENKLVVKYVSFAKIKL